VFGKAELCVRTTHPHKQINQEANSHRNDRLRCIRQVEVLTVIMFKNGFSPFRWRRLPGKIPGKDELRAKMSQLHERLDKKEDSLLEKHLILEEIASLSDRLRNQAAEGREDTLELAQKVSSTLLTQS